MQRPMQDNTSSFSINAKDREPEVLMSEIHQTIKRLKDGNATGAANLPEEALKAAGDTAGVAMKAIIDQTWMSGKWPSDWSISELITLPKIAGTQDCT